MASRTRPFAAFEWQIAWKYLRARRREGGVSVMSIISLVGVALAVFALIATLAVRTGYRTQFVQTIIGANPHITVFAPPRVDEYGNVLRGMEDYEEQTAKVASAEGVTHAAPLVVGQVMATANGRNTGAIIFGQRKADLDVLPLFAEAPDDTFYRGDFGRFEEGVSIGQGIASELGLVVGDFIDLISPDGVEGPFGTTPRINSYEVVHIFSAGRDDIDRSRIYLPFTEAQSYFNKEGTADRIDALVADPEGVDEVVPNVQEALGPDYYVQTWMQAIGSFLQTLAMEDNVMFILMSILVLVATLNIVSGLIMLVKNKGRDVGILRTMGLSEGSVLRVFFICGAAIGVIGTVIGVVLGVLFVLNIDPIFDFVNWVSGGGAWNPAKYQLYKLPAELRAWDIFRATGLALLLSFTVTYFPARRAARMNPVEALRYE